jgi:hypothetical protein
MGENEGGDLVLLDGEVLIGGEAREAREEGRRRGRAARPWGSRPAGGRGRPLTGGAGLAASARGRRGALALVGRVGRKRRGRRGLDGPAAGKKRKGKKKKRKVGWAAGREMGWVLFFFLLFFSNPFQTLLNSNLLHVFKFKF